MLFYPVQQKMYIAKLNKNTHRV